MLRYGREFRELGEVYELDEFGLFDEWRLKAEKFEDFTCKTVSTWHFTRKEYDTLLADLTLEEKLILKRKAKLKSYAQFKTILKRLEREKSDAIQDANKDIGKLNRYIKYEDFIGFIKKLQRDNPDLLEKIDFTYDSKREFSKVLNFNNYSNFSYELSDDEYFYYRIAKILCKTFDVFSEIMKDNDKTELKLLQREVALYRDQVDFYKKLKENK